jgi:hypothetical protein
MNNTLPKEKNSSKSLVNNLDKVPKDTQEEFGGPKGPEPTRYGDWEKGGRASDF